MTVEDAWKVIEMCRGWNTGQKSTDLAFDGRRTSADDVFDAQRDALAEAWRTIAKSSP